MSFPISFSTGDGQVVADGGGHGNSMRIATHDGRLAGTSARPANAARKSGFPYTPMTTACCALLGGVAALYSYPLAAQEYRFSDGPLVATWIRGPSNWDGRHSFLDVYCVDFPNARSVYSTAEGLLNGNTISYFRAKYKERVEAYVITSTIPDGRSESAEFAALLENETRNEANISAIDDSGRYSFTTHDSDWGRVIYIRMVNIAIRAHDDIFPLTRHLADEDVPPHSRTAHRVFVRGSNRFEIAVLGVPEDPEAEDAVILLERKIDALADQLTESLQQCTTANLQPGTKPE